MSLLREVEQGSRDAKPAITAAVAEALGVDVASLADQPYDQHDRPGDRIHAVIPALRRVLAYGGSWPELKAAARIESDVLASSLVADRGLDLRRCPSPAAPAHG